MPQFFAFLVVSTAALAFAQEAPAPRFDVASVKPGAPMTPAGLMVRSGSALPGGRWVAQNARFIDILRSAYPEFALRNQIAGGPAWINTARFDIDARAADDPPPERMRAMVHQLLADRFSLQTHVERRDLDVYALVVARADRRLGAGLRRAAADCEALRAARLRGDAPATADGARPLCSGRLTESADARRLMAGALSIAGLISMIGGSLREPIVDRTGLEGTFDIDLEWAIDASLDAAPTAVLGTTSAPVLFDALQRQLGLKLEPRRESTGVLVIDRVSMPAPD